MKLKFKPKKKPAKVSFFKPARINTKKNIKNIKRKNLTWSQATIRYPKMKAFGDRDKDKVPNMFDCKPFDNKRHGRSKLFLNEVARRLYDKNNEFGKDKNMYVAYKKTIKGDKVKDEDIARQEAYRILKTQHGSKIDLRTLKDKGYAEGAWRNSLKTVNEVDVIRHFAKHPQLLKEVENTKFKRLDAKWATKNNVTVVTTVHGDVYIDEVQMKKHDVGEDIEHEIGHVKQREREVALGLNRRKGTIQRSNEEKLSVEEYNDLPAERDAEFQRAERRKEWDEWKKEKPETLQSLQDELKEDL